jgi:hypothetical protein
MSQSFIDIVQRHGIGGYERAIVETWTVDGKRAARILPVDGGAILDEHGHPLPCWNALSPEQQHELTHNGGRVRHAEGNGCSEPAAVLVESPHDEEGPGPRFYCYLCAARYTLGLYKAHHKARKATLEA